MELKPGEIALLNCPFCGGKAKYHPAYNAPNPATGKQAVVCMSCQAQHNDYRAWNTRAQDKP